MLHEAKTSVFCNKQIHKDNFNFKLLFLDKLQALYP